MSDLTHSAKGTTWEKKDHKYLYKENGRYYYKDESFKALNDDGKNGYTSYKDSTGNHTLHVRYKNGVLDNKTTHSHVDSSGTHTSKTYKTISDGSRAITKGMNWVKKKLNIK